MTHRIANGVAGVKGFHHGFSLHVLFCELPAHISLIDGFYHIMPRLLREEANISARGFLAVVMVVNAT